MSTRNTAGIARKKNPEDIDVRKMNAGLLRLRNPSWSLKKVLMTAGYSELTARTPGKNNLTARALIAEAWSIEPATNPHELIRKTRRLLEKKLDVGLASPDAVSTGELTRLLSVCEASYGSEDTKRKESPREFADRMQWVVGLGRELEKRGLSSGESGKVAAAEEVEASRE